VDKGKGKKWVVIAAVCAGFLILDALFGVSNVRNSLRVFVLLLFLLGAAVLASEKIIVAFRTTHPPSQPKCAYHAIIARTKDGQLIWGLHVIGLLREGTKGYTPQPDLGIFADCDEAQRKADELNAQTGLSAWQINRIVRRWS
jgi:hypothetical protein